MPFSQAFDPIRSLKAAWKLLMQAPASVLIGGLVLWFLEGGAGGLARLGLRLPRLSNLRGIGDELERMFEDLQPVLLIAIPLAVCVGLAFFALSSWIETGFGRAIENGLRTGRDEVGRLFSGGDRFGAMLLARILVALVQLGVAIPMVALGIGIAFLAGHGRNDALGIAGIVLLSLVWTVVAVYVGLGLYLTKPIISLESCTPTEALARSWKLAGGNRWRLLWFALLQFLLSMAGMCACCIGVLLTAPLTITMRYEAYLALTRGAEFQQWWIGSGKFPFDEPKSESYASPPEPPPEPPPVPPPLPPQA